MNGGSLWRRTIAVQPVASGTESRGSEMKPVANPFEYEAAINLPPDAIIDYYIEDFNYSRFIRSRRNVFLVGERGCGKTMALVYNSLPMQLRKATKDKVPYDFGLLGIYVPCNTPLTHKSEYELLEPVRAGILSEHYLALGVAYVLADSLTHAKALLENVNQKALKDEVAFILDYELPDSPDLFEAVRQCIQKEVVLTQKKINEPESVFYHNARTLVSLVLPLLDIFKKIPALTSSHFMFMLDDAHDLNDYQIRSMNSWIAYRDHSAFSLKVATAKVGQPHLHTASGGTILEGHDFILIDMEQPYQNDDSNFYGLATKIIEKRLSEQKVGHKAEAFFPINPDFEKEMAECKDVVRKQAEAKYGTKATKQIYDYVYKYARVEWFRNRSPRANRPPYSGFSTLVFLSTGVIRNLLEPCYWMYDDLISRMGSADVTPSAVESIPPSLQTERILDRSRRMWDRLREGLDRAVEGCSRLQAIQLFNLFDQLAVLFRKRLLGHKSEPSAISFTISGRDGYEERLQPLIDIARKAQLLYARTGPAKEKGKREVYYVPNRMLWPDRGLDPHGQHARVSIKAVDLWTAAENKTEIPFESTTDDEPVVGDGSSQKGLFDE